MGNPNWKAASQTKITVINLQEELRKHREILQNHTTTMNQNLGGPPDSFTSIGFHGETLVTILVILAIVALNTYAALQCLKKGTLCPKYLEMEEQVRSRRDDNAVRIRPSLYPDLIHMTSEPSRASQIAMLPGEHVQGACWTTPMENYARNPAHEAEMSKFHGPIPAVFQSAANRPSFVVPPAASNAMNSGNCG